MMRSLLREPSKNSVTSLFLEEEEEEMGEILSSCWLMFFEWINLFIPF